MKNISDFLSESKQTVEIDYIDCNTITAIIDLFKDQMDPDMRNKADKVVEDILSDKKYWKYLY